MSGFFTEETPDSITKESQTQGLGTPESPMGAKIAGANPDQAKMTGTPAQKKDPAEKPPEDQASDPTSLESANRYGQPMASPDQAAQIKADTLKNLGPTRARVQGLVESKLYEVDSSKKSSLQIDPDAIAEQLDLTGDALTTAENALNAYVAVANMSDQEVLDKANASGYAFMSTTDAEKVAEYREALLVAWKEASGTASVDNFVLSSTESIGQTAADTAAIDEFNLGQLISEGLLPEAEAQELAQALGLNVEELGQLSLGELNAEIDRLESQEFNKVQSLEAQLSDPALSPTRREELQEELAQLTMGGVATTEDVFSTIDQQIDSDMTVEIAGKPMSVNDMLSSDEISSMIAKAIDDEDYLRKLSKNPATAGIALYIKENQDLLKEIANDLEITETSFLDTQSNAETLVTSMGTEEETKKLFGLILPGTTIPENWTTAQYNEYVRELEADPTYKLVKGNTAYQDEASVNKINGYFDIEVDGAPLDEDSVLDMLEFEEEWNKKDSVLKDLYPGVEFNAPTTPEEYAVWKSRMDDFESLSNVPGVELASWVKLGLDLEDMNDIAFSNGSPRSESQISAIITSIGNLGTAQDDWDLMIAQYPAGAALNKKLLERVGMSDLDEDDLIFAAEHGSDKAKEMIDALFGDGDGNLTRDEIAAIDLENLDSDKVQGILGLDMTNDDLISNIGVDPGTWSGTDIDIDKHANENAIREEYQSGLVEIQDAYTLASNTLVDIETNNSSWRPILAFAKGPNGRYSMTKLKEVRNTMFNKHNWESVNGAASSAHESLVDAKKAWKERKTRYENNSRKGDILRPKSDPVYKAYAKARKAWDDAEAARKDTWSKMSKDLEHTGLTYENAKRLDYNAFDNMSHKFKAYEDSLSAADAYMSDKKYEGYADPSGDFSY